MIIPGTGNIICPISIEKLYVYEPHRLECGRSRVRAPTGSNQNHTNVLLM